MPIILQLGNQVGAAVVQRREILITVWGILVAKIPSVGEAQIAETITLRKSIQLGLKYGKMRSKKAKNMPKIQK